MSRFIYYLIITNMVANLVAAIPRILLGKGTEGALISIVFALVFGVFMNWFFLNMIKQFPGKSLPELLKQYFHKWTAAFFLLFFFVIWYIAGLQTLIAYIDIMQHFLTSDMSVYVLFFLFIPCLTFGLLMRSRSILLSLEVLLVMFVPVLLLFLGEIYVTRQMDWDYAKIAVMHIENMPDYFVFAAGVYLFVGAFDLIIFNSFITRKVKFGWKQAGVVGLLGLLSLSTLYFIPIGILGFDEIDKALYPMILMSDSIRMKYGVVERVIFIFLLNFLAFAFLNIMIHWHVAFKLLQSVCNIEKLQGKRRHFSNAILLAALWVTALILMVSETEYSLFEISKYYFGAVPVMFAILMLLLMIMKRRAAFEKR